MIASKIYKLLPYVNNSFDETLKHFVNYIIQKFDIVESKYNNSVIIDNTKIGDMLSMTTPKHIYITICSCSNGCWSNSGGLEYCNFKTSSNVKIYVRWDTHIFNSNKEYEEINNNFFRKIKLEKIKNSIK